MFFVQVDKDTVWLTLDQMTELFQRSKSTISRHIQNVFNDGELDERAVVAKNATTTTGQPFSYYYDDDFQIKIRGKSSNNCISDEFPHYEARQ